MKRTFLMSIVMGLACMTGACGGSSAAASDGPSCSGVRQGIRFCTDVDGSVSNDTFKTACTTQLAGTFSSGPCNRTGVVGGCEASENGVDEITWVYQDSGATADQVAQGCAQANQSFVNP
jgi:hypothetical protein